MPPFYLIAAMFRFNPKIYFLILVCLSLLGCGDIKESEEYKKVVFDRDSLSEILEEREAELNHFVDEFDLIERNLAAIDSNKTRLVIMSTKGKITPSEKIHAMIADIYIAIDQNQSAISELEQKLKEANNSGKLATIIGILKKNLQAKEMEIELLKKELSSLQLEVKSLKDAVAFKESQLAARDTQLLSQVKKLELQEKLIQQKENELSKAYYIRGTVAELQKAGIIKKEGGIAGIGSVKVLGEKLGGDKLRSVNVRTDKMLLVGRYKKKMVISNHPSDSYFFIAKEGQIFIKITYPEKFWSLSKYLVVAVE